MSDNQELLAVDASIDEEKSFRNKQLIVFKLGAEEYGLAIEQVKEIVLTPTITKMPQTASYIKGVANIRGNIIAIVDLEEKFTLLSKKDLEDSKVGKYTLVIESDVFKIGILAKGVPNTLAIADSDIDDTLNAISESSMDDNYIKGIVKIDDRLIILIDILKVLSESEINQALRKS